MSLKDLLNHANKSVTARPLPTSPDKATKMDSRCCHPTLIMIFALISNGLLSAHQAFSTLEEVISVNKLLNNC